MKAALSLASKPSKNIESGFKACGKANVQNAKPRLQDNSHANQPRPPHAALPGRAFRARFSCRRQQRAAGRRRAAGQGTARHGTLRHAADGSAAPAPMAASTARAALPFNAARPSVPSGRRAPRAGQVRRGRAPAAAAPPPPHRTAPAGSPGTGEAAAAGSRPRLSGKRPPARRRERGPRGARAAPQRLGDARTRAEGARCGGRSRGGDSPAAGRPRSGASRHRRERPAPHGSARAPRGAPGVNFRSWGGKRGGGQGAE